MTHFPNRAICRPTWSCLVCVLLCGCAALPQGHLADAADPYERFNSTVFSFNDSIDKALIKPIAEEYQFVIPKIACNAASQTFFSNISDLPTAANEVLQGKARQGKPSSRSSRPRRRQHGIRIG